MAQRMSKKTWMERVSIALTAAAVAEKGKMACLSNATGKLVAASVATTLLPIGYFDTDATGDGTTEVPVTLFRGVWVHWFDNDGVNPVAASDIGDICYIKDPATVTALSTGASIAGRVWAISTVDGVGVEFKGFSNG